MSSRLAVVVGALTATVAAATPNALKAIDVKPTATGAQVRVNASASPTFTVFRLNDPDRLVVDISGADASAVKGHHEGAGPVSGVVASQFQDDRNQVGRVLVALDKASKYDVRAEGSQVVISIEGEGRAQAPAVAPAKEEKGASIAEARPAPARANAPEASPNAAAEPGVVASRLDEKQVENPATKLTGIRLKNDRLTLTTDGELARFELIELADPPRLAIDLFGVKSATRAKVAGGLVRSVRIGAWDDKTRLVVDLDGEMPAYKAARNGKGVTLSFERKGEVASVAEKSNGESEVVIDGQSVSAETAPVLTARPVKEIDGLAEVRALDFEESAEGGQVVLKLQGEAKFKVERPDGTSAVLTLEGARLPKKLERSLDTSALATPVKMVSAYAAPGGDRVRVVVASDAALDETVVKTPNGLSWRLSLKGSKPDAVATEAKSAGFASEAQTFAERGAPQRARYVGKKVSFEFKDIDIHNLLRIIAEISKKNIVVADDVNGKITIRLRNVPWDQALDLILRSKGLGQEDLGNIIRVAPLGRLEEEARLRAERKKAQEIAEPLQVVLVPVNYATADQMAGRVKDVLSPRGNVSIDARTNTLIVRDVGANLGKVKSMVASLDTQTPQVLIESRIVEANTRFQREVGIQWGGNVQFAPSTGNATGLAFPNTVSVAGAAGNQGTDGTATTPNYAVNLPVGIGLGSGGGLGFVFGSAGGALQLNLRLSALESQGVVKTISAPKVTTLDNNTARISQGVSIPFSQVSAGGVNTAFIEASLSLEVTPHITQDGSVLMNIRASNNQPDPSSTGANGQPSIQRKEAATQVLVKDSDTTVIGGIYVKSSSTNSSGVPLLSKIPILGFFFKNHRELETRSELLIFITPRILNRQQMAVSN